MEYYSRLSNALIQSIKMGKQTPLARIISIKINMNYAKNHGCPQFQNH